MKENYQDGESYLTSFPKYRKWINECITCHSKGYKPDMPSHHVRGYFDPLPVNNLGVCEQCKNIVQRTEEICNEIDDNE